MNEKNQILGNEEQGKQIPELLRKAAKDRLIEGIVKGKIEGGKTIKQPKDFPVGPGLNVRNLFYACDDSIKLLKAIEKKAHFDKRNTMLFSDAQRTKTYSTIANSLISVIYSCNGSENLGNALIERIEKYIGFDKTNGLARGQYMQREEGDEMRTRDSAALCLAYLAAGQREKASRLIKKIELEIGFDEETGLAGQDEFRDNILVTDVNALLALDYIVLGKRGFGEQIIKAIEEHIGFDENTRLANFRNDDDGGGLFSDDSAALCLAYFGLGKGTEPMNLIKKIENYFGFQKGLLRHEKHDKSPTSTFTHTSAMMTLAYMGREAFLVRFPD